MPVRTGSGNGNPAWVASSTLLNPAPLWNPHLPAHKHLLLHQQMPPFLLLPKQITSTLQSLQWKAPSQITLKNQLRLRYWRKVNHVNPQTQPWLLGAKVMQRRVRSTRGRPGRVSEGCRWWGTISWRSCGRNRRRWKRKWVTQNDFV